MSSVETERFLKQWAATVPLPEGPGEGTLVSYDELCQSVGSYLNSIRTESSELPAELKMSEEMQLYQARQTTVLEFWGFNAHGVFPPPPESASISYEAAALYRIESLLTKQDIESHIISPLKPTSQAPSSRPAPESTTTVGSPLRTFFRKLTSSTKARSYRKHDFNREKSGEEQQTDTPQSIDQQNSPATPSAKTKSPQKSINCVQKQDGQSPKATPSGDQPKLPVAASQPSLQLSNGRHPPTGPSSTVIGAVASRYPVPPIWPGIKLEDGWDFLTGFPSGSFVLSTTRAFSRIVGPIIGGVGEIIGGVNKKFPLLRLRWERTPLKPDGRRDLAVWVEFGIGTSHSDPEAVAQKDVMIRGLREFHRRDAAGWDKYLNTFFEENIERFRAESWVYAGTAKQPDSQPEEARPVAQQSSFGSN